MCISSSVVCWRMSLSRQHLTKLVLCALISSALTLVCVVLLWQLLRRLSLPESFVRVLRALHDHTSFRVFIHNGYSDPWFTERGLREGCPSSLVLFSIFQYAVMLTFRACRAEKAASLGAPPGIPWCFKVDGRLTRSGKARHSSRQSLVTWRLRMTLHYWASSKS